jgi:hypothetical protein
MAKFLGKPEESSEVVTPSELFQVIGELYVRNLKLEAQLGRKLVDNESTGAAIYGGPRHPERQGS